MDVPHIPWKREIPLQENWTGISFRMNCAFDFPMAEAADVGKKTDNR